MEDPSLLDLILHVDHDITRHFECDYILFDALFLALYVTLSIRRGRIAPLKAGLICAPFCTRSMGSSGRRRASANTACLLRGSSTPWIP